MSERQNMNSADIDTKSLPGNDHYHAFDSFDFIRLRTGLGRLQTLLGPKRKSVLASEEDSRKHARRSLVVRNL